MVADLFGVSPLLIEAAANRIPQDFSPLTVGAPSAWRDALGLEWVGAAGGPPINLRPGPIWRDAVARQVVPRLPGRWLARDYDLVRLPASPVTCLVSPGRLSGHAVICPMYIPDQFSLQFSVGLRSAVNDRAPDPIEPLLAELTGVALPFFDRYGHPDGLRALCRERVDAAPAGHVNPHDLRCLAATEVVLGRYAEAAASYASLAERAAGASQDWLKELGEEARARSVLLLHEPTVVHDALRATIDRQVSKGGLEAPQP
ncbi:hypothetical protein [Actinoplanes sp. NPDC051411]|uniref:hypothetical protein n=1 Tax=Actinoplanes sp. NPDC051411 TaxID=3155522 RepID=UPI0034242FBE